MREADGSVMDAVEHVSALDGKVLDVTSTFRTKSGLDFVSKDDKQGNTSIVHVDRDGAKTADEWTKADGSFGENSYDPASGKRSGTTTKADQTSITYTKDGIGGMLVKSFDKDRQLIGDSWTRPDGTHGSNSYDPVAGAITGVKFAADGSSERFTDDLHGNKQSATFDANNKPTGGKWEKADGSFGSEKIVNGVKTIDFNDGDGGTKSQTYGADGRLVSDTWGTKDGARGTNGYNADGSSFGSVKMPDGTSRTYVRAADGTQNVELFNSWGPKTTHLWNNPDGSHGVEKFDGMKTSGVFIRADKTSQSFTDDGKGNVVFREADANDKTTSVSWWQSDGTHGSEKIGPDLARTGLIVSPNGHYTRYTSDENGNATTNKYDAKGELIASSWKDGNGGGGGRVTTPEGVIVVYGQYGPNGRDGKYEEIYQRNGVVRKEVTDKEGRVRQVLDDGMGTRIETTYGPGGIGITSNTTTKYKPDGSGTVTTTDKDLNTTEKHVGPGSLKPIKVPVEPGDTPAWAIPGHVPSEGTGEIPDNAPPDGPRIPEGDLDGDSDYNPNDYIGKRRIDDIFDGGAGIDTLTGGSGNELFIGGTGNDSIVTSTGADIIAFNRGDGQDTVAASIGKDNTVSLGKGVTYADLLFKKAGNDLVLVTGASEQLTFKDCYLSANKRSVANLQVVIEGGSDTAAIGGDLAYQYARNGNLSALSLAPADALLAAAPFGAAVQNLQAGSALQDLSPRLA
ncbi:calcium-binding protein [Massilia scottii]|uniref:calcium-binding protein n=1 Tax=Massilia scottii TaxID=3057166 RepID=UPI002796C145|nr:calcium-binding protein [Massilia sp. CCM 9029]MDQ1829714.1 calcium-binding protein [Massilia sp. CCM 9029]